MYQGVSLQIPPPSNRFWPFEGGGYFLKNPIPVLKGGGIPRKISFETFHFQTQSVCFFFFKYIRPKVNEKVKILIKYFENHP